MGKQKTIDQCYLDMFSEFDDILCVADVCRMLKTDSKKAYRLIRSGEIKSIRYERSIRTAKLWVIEYIQECGMKSDMTIHQQRQEMILHFCLEPKSRRQMQEYLDISDKKHFRDKVLYPLLEQGLLLPTIPEVPNHVKQRYVTVK